MFWKLLCQKICFSESDIKSTNELIHVGCDWSLPRSSALVEKLKQMD